MGPVLTCAVAQIGLVCMCIMIHFVAGQIIEYLADKERGPWLTAERERRIRLSLLDLQTRLALQAALLLGIVRWL